MTPGARFSGRLMRKDDCMNSGGLSLSSSTEHITVVVLESGRALLSRAWTGDRNRKEKTQRLTHQFFFIVFFTKIFKCLTPTGFIISTDILNNKCLILLACSLDPFFYFSLAFFGIHIAPKAKCSNCKPDVLMSECLRYATCCYFNNSFNTRVKP